MPMHVRVWTPVHTPYTCQRTFDLSVAYVSAIHAESTVAALYIRKNMNAYVQKYLQII